MKKRLILVAYVKDDKLFIHTKAEGFDSMGIIGILEKKKDDIFNQLNKDSLGDKEITFVRKRVKED